eukprot:COSAG02_NODE_17081_length_1030_cov_0.950591_1_plen_54_part_01
MRWVDPDSFYQYSIKYHTVEYYSEYCTLWMQFRPTIDIPYLFLKKWCHSLAPRF